MNRPNKYAAPCRNCRQPVAPGAGWIEKVNGKWLTQHTDTCPTGEAVPAEPVAVVTHPPTAEQSKALDLYGKGEDMVIEALAGTGKTTTLRLLANSDLTKKVQYVAFNKKIVVEVDGSMPANVTASTAHSLAYQAVGKHYSKRLRAPRQTSAQIAHLLGITPIHITLGDEVKTLQPSYLAGLTMSAIGNFCQTADPAPHVRHIPYVDGIDAPDAFGRRTYEHNDYVRDEVITYVTAAWADLSRTNGQLRFGHDHYLKLWQLSEPVINADVIMFDEAQDANPVMAAVVAAQRCQKVYVGDSNQAIYEFTGAVNALAGFQTDHRAQLTQSFRFGPAVADAANEILAKLATDMRVTGTPTIESTTGPFDGDVDAILSRTNAAAIVALLSAKERGVKAHLVGGGAEVLRFAYGARDLQNGRTSDHPDLGCFDSWAEVQAYVEQDEQGDDLKLMVELVDRFTVNTIIDALDRMPSEDEAELTISTAHKAKGLEWDRVRLADDFVRTDKEGKPQEPTEQELRLQYVACTRARRHLDHSALTPRTA